MTIRNVLQIFGEIIRDLKNPNEWDKVIREINKGTPIEEINCPICDRCELEFNYTVLFRDSSNPKRNRAGGGWAACRNCEAAIMWDGKIPDWYVEPEEET